MSGGSIQDKVRMLNDQLANAHREYKNLSVQYDELNRQIEDQLADSENLDSIRDPTLFSDISARRAKVSAEQKRWIQTILHIMNEIQRIGELYESLDDSDGG